MVVAGQSRIVRNVDARAVPSEWEALSCVAVSITAPPYARFSPPIQAASIHESELCAGAIFGLAVDGDLKDGETLRSALQSLRRRFPAVPVVLRIPPRLDGESTWLIQRATQLHARGVIMDGEPVREALERFLTAPVDLATDVVEWLSLRLHRLSPEVANLVLRIFEYAPTQGTIAPLLHQIGESARTARARLRKLALPSPSRWLQAARAVHAALSMQRAQSTPLLKLALELGYSDHSALSHQLVRVCGMQATVVRQLLGWEWLLDTWLAGRCRV